MKVHWICARTELTTARIRDYNWAGRTSHDILPKKLLPFGATLSKIYLCVYIFASIMSVWRHIITTWRDEQTLLCVSPCPTRAKYTSLSINLTDEGCDVCIAGLLFGEHISCLCGDRSSFYNISYLSGVRKNGCAKESMQISIHHSSNLSWCFRERWIATENCLGCIRHIRQCCVIWRCTAYVWVFIQEQGADDHCTVHHVWWACWCQCR